MDVGGFATTGVQAQRHENGNLVQCQECQCNVECQVDTLYTAAVYTGETLQVRQRELVRQAAAAESSFGDGNRFAGGGAREAGFA